MDTLKAAVRYQANPVVRVEAVEALESCGLGSVLPWLRAAITDDHPAVRFAACVAVGRRGDHVATSSLRDRVYDEDASVQVAALFALHQLGHTEGTGRIPTYLVARNEVTVRRNTALLLGMFDAQTSIKVLARAMRDTDEGVRHHALEAMAKHGVHEAKQELAFMTSSGVGSQEVFAIAALAGTGDKTYVDTFRYKMKRGVHLETRLAAARALGDLGLDDGFELALQTIRRPVRVRRASHDGAGSQRLRTTQLSAAVLGVIGRLDALPSLSRLLKQSRDPRIQVSVAKAILDILQASDQHEFPFAADHQRGGL